MAKKGEFCLSYLLMHAAGFVGLPFFSLPAAPQDLPSPIVRFSFRCCFDFLLLLSIRMRCQILRNSPDKLQYDYKKATLLNHYQLNHFIHPSHYPPSTILDNLLTINSANSKVAHHCRAHHQHGHDRLLQDARTPPYEPAAQHAQVRPCRAQKGAVP